MRCVWLASLLGAADAVTLRGRKRAPANEDFKVRLDNVNNLQYQGLFTVGGQSLPVVYDTGSFEVMLLSKLCGERCTRGKKVFDANLSKTFVPSEEQMGTFFGSGPVVARKGFDAVGFGAGDSPYMVDKLAIWQIVEHGVGAVWDKATFSGIVGLSYLKHAPKGFQTRSKQGNSTEKDSLLLSAMDVQLFAFCLERQHGPGWFVVGPTVETLAKDPRFTSVPVVGDNHWAVKAHGVEATGLHTQNPCNPTCSVLIDSGTSLLTAPLSARPMVLAIEQKLKHDCSNLADMPVLRFDLGGGILVELPPAAYVFTISGICVTMLSTAEMESQFGPVWVLGMPFLRYYYTIFDKPGKMIHFAASTPSCEVLEKGDEADIKLEWLRLYTQTRHRVFEPSDYEPLEGDRDLVLPARTAVSGRL